MKPIRTGILVVIVVLVVGGGVWAFVNRDKISGNAGDLQVGDCFEVPVGDTIQDVQHHPCTEAHDGEVILIADYTGGTGTYPTVADFDDWANAQCTPAFQTYTGDAYDTRTDVSIGYFYPLEEGWGKGDRQMICYASPSAGATVTQSYRKPAAS